MRLFFQMLALLSQNLFQTLPHSTFSRETTLLTECVFPWKVLKNEKHQKQTRTKKTVTKLQRRRHTASTAQRRRRRQAEPSKGSCFLRTLFVLVKPTFIFLMWTSFREAPPPTWGEEKKHHNQNGGGEEHPPEGGVGSATQMQR